MLSLPFLSKTIAGSLLQHTIYYEVCLRRFLEGFDIRAASTPECIQPYAAENC